MLRSLLAACWQLLAESLPDGHAIGVDRSAAMVRLAQAKLVKGKTERASVVYSEEEGLIFKGAVV